MSSKVHKENSNMRIVEENIVDIFFLVITKVALGCIVNPNMVEVLPSWNLVVLEDPYECFDFIKNV